MPTLSALRTCEVCGKPYQPIQAKQRYCAKRECRQEGARRAKQQRPSRSSQRCAACHADISQRGAGALYCVACATERRRANSTRPMRDAARRTVERKPSTSTRPKTRRQQQAQAGIKDHSLPNLEGDWWPGWDGCYSPNLSPLAKDLLRREVARFAPANKANQTSATAFRDRTPYEEAS